MNAKNGFRAPMKLKTLFPFYNRGGVKLLVHYFWGHKYQTMPMNTVWVLFFCSKWTLVKGFLHLGAFKKKTF